MHTTKFHPPSNSFKYVYQFVFLILAHPESIRTALINMGCKEVCCSLHGVVVARAASKQSSSLLGHGVGAVKCMLENEQQLMQGADIAAQKQAKRVVTQPCDLRGLCLHFAMRTLDSRCVAILTEGDHVCAM